jgi:hypothetical protein
MLAKNQENKVAPVRTCGPCTSCCEAALRINVKGRAVSLGKPCPFLGEHRCMIYEDRPNHPCRSFICGWLAPASPLPEWMRPDQAKVIVLLANFTWRGLPVDVAVATGDHPNNEAIDWLRQYSSVNKRALLYQAANDWYAFGPRQFQVEMAESVTAGAALWLSQRT